MTFQESATGHESATGTRTGTEGTGVLQADLRTTRRWRGIAAAACAVTLLAACQDGGDFALFSPKGGATEASGPARATKLVERDVEAPEVFQVTEAGLWDGRPSLGGVWVAHPDVTDPERVIIRNESNGNFVIGALFRRERAMPGPRLQVSSDAAATLGMLAGKPVELNVTALRREEVAEDPVPAPAEAETLAAPDAIEATALDPAPGAAAALDAVEAESPPAPVMAPEAMATPSAAAPAPAPAAAPAKAPAKASTLSKPYLQIGIFSVEANAENAAGQMRNAGMVPTIRKQTTQGKTFWRVVVGPAATAGERDSLLKKIKATGFTDAYAVTN